MFNTMYRYFAINSLHVASNNNNSKDILMHNKLLT